MKKTSFRTVLFVSTATLALSFTSLFAAEEKTPQGKELLDMVFVQGADIKGDFKYNSNIFRDGTTVKVPDFYISKFEVSQELYTKILKDSKLELNAAPFHFKGNDLPAECMTWFDAVYFCNELSLTSNLMPAYTMENITVEKGHIVRAKVTLDQTKNGYRLPSETEWEYAARGGKNMETYLYTGSDVVNDVAWTSANAEDKSHKVGSKKPNSLGIYDMSGNVWEYIYDGYGNSIDSTAANYHIIKGGGWWNYINFATVSANFIWTDNDGDGDLGFRVVRNAK